MKLPNWQKLRILILGCCNFTIILALVFLFNKSEQSDFPQDIAWQNWEVIYTQKISAQEKPLVGRKYH